VLPPRCAQPSSHLSAPPHLKDPGRVHPRRFVFGAGPESLAILRRLPLDLIKLGPVC
jgi:hypothetical protein